MRDGATSGGEAAPSRPHRLFRSAASPVIYGAAKTAVSLWVRQNAVRADWAGAGIRLNAIAPGAIRTPMLEDLMTTEAERKRIEAVPAPIGGLGDASQIGDWVVFMLSDAADYLVGTTVFVDGGSDAYFRPTAWPKAVPMWDLVGYFRRLRAFGNDR
ncbi:SDR family oxidoreductase [Nocardia cerradoensis]|nr:SDR family oxidoreductase [Nocardia cerradoensis]